MLEGIGSMFDELRPMLKKLKKKTYEANSRIFVEKFGGYFQEMTDYVGSADDKETASKEVGQKIASEVKSIFSNKRGKIDSGTQADLNMFMIFYVFPTLLKTGYEDVTVIADGICDQWGIQFKGNNIRYTDYDSLYETFREKVFGIF